MLQKVGDAVEMGVERGAVGVGERDALFQPGAGLDVEQFPAEAAGGFGQLREGEVKAELVKMFRAGRSSSEGRGRRSSVVFSSRKCSPLAVGIAWSSRPSS